jgi:predicted DCC family thiol-disulfide oxidoreductase YuxK
MASPADARPVGLLRRAWPAPLPGPPSDSPVFLFDGVCNLCNGSVDFILRHDRSGRLRFASLQSPLGRACNQAAGLCADELDSMMLLEEGRLWTRSSAVLRTAWLLGLPWSLAAILFAFPAPLRDAAYGILVRNRYRWFGVSETCRVPTPDERARFVA